MAEELRKEDSNAKGLRKKINAAWSEHSFALTLRYWTEGIVLNVFTEKKKAEDASEEEW